MTIPVFEDQNSASAEHKCQIIHLHICKIYLILDAGAQVLALGGCKEVLCEEGLGLPCARYNRFQPAPMDPQEDTAEPLSHGWGTTGKVKCRTDQ